MILQRVFFIFDDSFITNLKLREINLIFKIAVEKDLDSVSLRKKSFDYSSNDDQFLYLINPSTKYRNSLFLNLMKKDVLVKLLMPRETAWQFEKQGNIRSKEYRFYSVHQKDLGLYHHGIVKGKWFPEVYKYLRAKGYSLDTNSFKMHSEIRVIIMKVYTFGWYYAQKFLHSISRKYYS